jgi:hypothetical protein
VQATSSRTAASATTSQARTLPRRDRAKLDITDPSCCPSARPYFLIGARGFGGALRKLSDADVLTSSYTPMRWFR